MSRKPIIGVISARHPWESLIPQYSTSEHYLEQVAAAGGIPVQIPILAGASQRSLDALVAVCDGFLFPGGGDFDPDWYGEALLSNLSPDPTAIDRGSQEAALRFIRTAAASGKPVLGICLGMQVTMVALGGSLYQDIPTQITTSLRHGFPMNVLEDHWQIAHSVRTAENSLIRTLSGAAEIWVNSFHHQAVKRLAPGFRATAWAGDGIVEAAERVDGKILLVQWHPENLGHAGVSHAQMLFRWLTESASTV